MTNSVSTAAKAGWGIALLCVLPFLLNVLGVDFSSSVTELTTASFVEGKVEVDALFHATAGALHHVLLEWSAVCTAFVAAIVSVLHFRQCRDITVPIMGMALFSAGMVDAFHTMAATRIIDARAPNTDFIPFTWALSRVFNASIMIAAASTALWIQRLRSRGQQDEQQGRLYRGSTLVIIVMTFTLLAYFVVQLAVVSESLPQTQYQNALISRPFDVLPLALFIFAGTLFFSWYRQSGSVLHFSLMLSVLPAIATQLHMAFGSQALFDNHFNIAHGLKILAYACILMGILLDLAVQRRQVNDEKAVQQNTTDLPARDSYAAQQDAVQLPKIDNTLDVGKAEQPLALQLPVAAFVLSILVSISVGSVFFLEADRLLTGKQAEELRVESKLVEPFLEQMYRQAINDVAYFANMPLTQRAAEALAKRNKADYEQALAQLKMALVQWMTQKSAYTKVNFIGVKPYDSEWLAVERDSSGVRSWIESALLSGNEKLNLSIKSHDIETTHQQSSNFGEPAISNVQYPGRGEIPAGTPYKSQFYISNPVAATINAGESKQVVARIQFEVDFSWLVEEFNRKGLENLVLYIADEQGAILYQPTPSDPQKLVARTLNVLFPSLILSDGESTYTSLKDIYGQTRASISYLTSLNIIGMPQSFRILLQHKRHTSEGQLMAYRDRTVIAGLSAAVLALALSVLISRRITQPLAQLTVAVQQYETGNTPGKLPVKSRNELGVLARSFYNMAQRTNVALREQKKSESFALDTSEHLSAVVNSAAEGIITIDTKGKILTFNRAAEKMFGYVEKDMIGKSISCLMPSQHAKQHDHFLEYYLKTGKSNIMGVGRELTALKKTGQQFPIHLTISEIHTGRGLVFTGLIRDITEENKAKQALIDGKNAAEQAAQYKSSFLASMSHEIRTPMNGVLGMLHLLLKSNLDASQHHYAILARSSAESLLTLINDILDFSKVEAGKLELENLDFNLQRLLSEFAESIAHQAQEKGLELILDTSGIMHHMVKGDPGRIRQVLNNLVGNAIKFTDHGEVFIQAELMEKSSAEYIFKCKIKDTGIGMPESMTEKIFDSFTQLDSSSTRRFGGTGLGLSIVKQLCTLMSGDVWARSEEGVGSVFEFEVSLGVSHQSEMVMPKVEIKGVPILVVDDNTTNREVLKGQLELWGADVSVAMDGPTALLMLKRRYEDKQNPMFKVVFLDFQMPGMDGIELAKSIRRESGFKEVKLVVMTSISKRGDAQMFADLEFNAYFSKPVTPSDLFDALSVVLSGGEVLEQAKPLITQHYLHNLKKESEADKETSNNVWPASTRLLLVEDNQINQIVAQDLLEQIELSCDLANNGLEAVEALRDAPNDSPYTLILMDCQMPEMDGYEATRMIREGAAGDEYKNVPIIALTANAMSGDRDKCLAAGMNDYLSKPIEVEQLDKVLRKWIHEKGEYVI